MYSEKLKSAVLNGQISHAYIFEGNSESLKQKATESFLKDLLCLEGKGQGCGKCSTCKQIINRGHPDVTYVTKEKNSIKDEAISDLQQQLRKKPYQGTRLIAVIEDADLMTPRAQNRLLKTLEEPFPGTIIILHSTNTEHLLPTVISRCGLIRFQDGENDDAQEQTAHLIGKMLLEGAPFYKTKALIGTIIQRRADSLNFLDSLEVFYRDELLYGKLSTEETRKRLIEAIYAIEDARRDLQRTYAVGVTMKHLLIKIGG